MTPSRASSSGGRMRSLFSAIAIFVLLGTAFAQANSDKNQTNNKKPEPPPAAKRQENKPPENATPPPAVPEQKPSAQNPSDKDKDTDKEEHFDMTEVPPIVTHHQITVNGKPLKYTATTGRLPIKRGDGKIEAEMFFVAYTLDGQDAAKRPLTFAFNGGPGSATIWLHMGALGPRKVVLQPEGFMPPAPYHIEDNPYTLLDKTDLVMIDAINTGFSRAADHDMLKKFW